MKTILDSEFSGFVVDETKRKRLDFFSKVTTRRPCIIYSDVNLIIMIRGSRSVRSAHLMLLAARVQQVLTKAPHKAVFTQVLQGYDLQMLTVYILYRPISLVSICCLLVKPFELTQSLSK